MQTTSDPVVAKLDALAAVLTQQLETQRLHTEIKLSFIKDLKRHLGSPEVPPASPATIRPPRPGAVSQYAWVRNLLEANPDGLTSNQVITFLAPIIASNARDRRKVLYSALSALTNDGHIVRVNGVYRLA
jgi:hypothetical protein